MKIPSEMKSWLRTCI